MSTGIQFGFLTRFLVRPVMVVWAWFLRTAPAVMTPEALVRPGLSMNINKTRLGAHSVVNKLLARDYFSNRRLGSVTLSGKLNPFSPEEDVRAVFESGEVALKRIYNSDGRDRRTSLSAAPVRVNLTLYIDPDKFRPRECADETEVDGTHAVVDCECLNARGVKKTCHLEFDDGLPAIPAVGQQCCDQLNTTKSNLKVVRGSFEAQHCHNLCGSPDPKLLIDWCPPEGDA